MRLANVLARSLLKTSGDFSRATGALEPDLLVGYGFPGALPGDGGDHPGTTKCVCLFSGREGKGYPADLLDAFDDYERYADTREMPSGGPLLSPVIPAGPLLEPFRIASYPEERYLLTRGNLPLPCPKCGRIVHAVGRGPVSSMAEYFEYECCHLFYYFHPFREWAFDRALYDPAENTLYHHGHKYARREFLIRMFEDFRRNLVVCLREILQEGEIKAPRPLNGTIPVLIGRGEINPGHVIFEDLAGVFLLCEAMETCGVQGKLDILVSGHATWFEPLLRILPRHRIAQVTPVPSDMAHILLYVNRNSLTLVNLNVHPCWPHTLHGCGYLKKMCQRIVALASQNTHAVSQETMRVIFPIRTHNRSWEPLFENVQWLIEYLSKYYSPVHFILHAVNTQGSGYDPFRNLANQREDVELLFDEPLAAVLAHYAAADLCVGPIGSGFWWAGLFGVPSVTVHPQHNPDTVEQGAWILPPPKGRCSPFLSLNPNQRCAVVVDQNSNRETYGSLCPPLDDVIRAIDDILKPIV